MNNPQYFDFELNNQQQDAFNLICEFVNSDKQVFVLKGSAGTGKTTLVKGLCNYFTDIKKEPILLATTGRAAKILRNKTNIETSTIHSHIFTMKQIKLTKTVTK